MQFLIVVRHGEYSPDARRALDSQGIRQMNDLARKLMPFIIDMRLAILCSPALRVVQSAEILANALGGTIEQNEIFQSSGSQDPRTAQAMEIIDAQEAEVVIVVTHYEYTAELPRAYGARLGRTTPADLFPRSPSEKGEARVIDITARTCTHVGLDS